MLVSTLEYARYKGRVEKIVEIIGHGLFLGTILMEVCLKFKPKRVQVNMKGRTISCGLKKGTQLLDQPKQPNCSGYRIQVK
jgi:hypothetical protein